MGTHRNMLLFALDPDPALGGAIATELDLVPAPFEDRRFPDGEHKLRPLVDPAGADVCVVQSLHGRPGLSPYDALCRLMFFVATLRDHGAVGVTAVVPYLAYARKDRRTKPHDPLGVRHVAQLMEAAGTGRLVVLEVHNLPALENAYRVPLRHVPAHPAFDAVVDESAGAGGVTVVSPDPGGVKRAQVWREALEARLLRPVGFAMVDKRRSAGVVTGGELVAGDVAGTTAFVLDDLIATGGTIRRAALALRRAGAARVVACAAHGLFVEPAADELADPAVSAVVVTDSVPAFRVPGAGPLAAKLRVVPAAPLLADAVRAGLGPLSP